MPAQIFKIAGKNVEVSYEGEDPRKFDIKLGVDRTSEFLQRYIVEGLRSEGRFDYTKIFDEKASTVDHVILKSEPSDSSSSVTACDAYELLDKLQKQKIPLHIPSVETFAAEERRASGRSF